MMSPSAILQHARTVTVRNNQENRFVNHSTVTPEQIEALRQFDSPTISNAIEHFDVRDPVTGYTTNELVCHTPEITTPLVGFAVTAMGDTTLPGDTRPSRVGEVVELIEASPAPRVLVVQHSGHDRRRACMFGDMFATILDKLGVTGIVSDMNARDRVGIRQRAPEFHLFTAGWVVSHGAPRYVDLNTVVTVCGLTVHPGDLLHGDESGLVSIPLNMVDDVIKQAQKVREHEAEYFDFLQSGRFNMEELKRRIKPEANK